MGTGRWTLCAAGRTTGESSAPQSLAASICLPRHRTRVHHVVATTEIPMAVARPSCASHLRLCGNVSRRYLALGLRLRVGTYRGLHRTPLEYMCWYPLSPWGVVLRLGKPRKVLRITRQELCMEPALCRPCCWGSVSTKCLHHAREPVLWLLFTLFARSGTCTQVESI
jgi:hypothetical protein